MSSKPRKKSEPKEEVVKAPKEAPKRPSGRAPEPMVLSRHGTGFVTRQGKGFSAGELSGAGLAMGLASRWGLRVDQRRRSVLENNVDSLKRWGSHSPAETKVEGRVKRVEEEVQKVEREVKKEAAEVKAEVAKVGKAVKKEAAKAEKKVKAKAKPKAKPKKKAKG